MTFKLRQMGFHLNHKTVLRLMNELGIHSILRKKRHGKRGKTSHIAPNLLNRDFIATALNQKWVTDVTEFQVGQEKLYFSPLMDLANREIIAYNFSTRPKFSLVKKMLEQGLSRIKPTECPIIHSDQGVLYSSAEWVKMLEGKAVQSMSRRGNCYDNAVIESFFAILKSACFYSRTYHSIAELQAAPSIPTFLTENGLTYCTHASGFSFNPQTDVTRRLVESYFGKILDETAWVKDKNTH